MGAGVVAALLGLQGLAASAPIRSDVLMLLTPEGLLAGVGDGLRRGYALAMEEARVCGVKPPTLQLGWLPPEQDPRAALTVRPLPGLLIAPPAVSLVSYGLLAQELGLTVLLPLQRGSSLNGLPSLAGADRLWPVLPARSLEADRLAKGLIEEKRSRVMVIHDGSSEQIALANRFVASLSGDGGRVVGYQEGSQEIADPDARTITRLVDDVDYYRPEALVVMTAPTSPLAKAVREARWPADLTLVWPFPATEPLANAQLGVDPLSRGPGWNRFAANFQRRYNYVPSLVEATGYDTGQLAAVTARRPGDAAPWDMAWLDPKAQPRALCAAIESRRQGGRTALKGAASQLDLGAGSAPSAELRLTPLPAAGNAPPS